mmetsp:Transcript_1402/g.4753  ORF Transcript_1402/g.4753 Transcript_1402/m.4753 type:complete len:235 (-) Transcript_1402:1231-1935(-)
MPDLRRRDRGEGTRAGRDHAVPQHRPVPPLHAALLGFQAPNLRNENALRGIRQKSTQRHPQRGVVGNAHRVLRAFHLRHERAPHAEFRDSLPGVARDRRPVALFNKLVRRFVHHPFAHGIASPEKLVRAAVNAKRRHVNPPTRSEQTSWRVRFVTHHRGRRASRRRRNGGRLPQSIVPGTLNLGTLASLFNRPVREVVGFQRVRDVYSAQQLGFPRFRLAAETQPRNPGKKTRK